MSLARRGVAALLVLLCGCAVGPRFKSPAAPTGAAGAFLSTGASAVAEAPPDHWWRLYQDPVLDRLVTRALTENDDLKVAAANLAYAEGLLGEARAGRFPGTTVSGGAPTYGRSASQISFGAGASTTYSASFSASYQVDLFGRIRRSIQAARANLEATRLAEDVVRVTIAGATANAYAQVCGYGEQADAARRSIEILSKTYELTRAQRDAGALGDFDLDRQSVLLEQARAALPPLEGQRRASLFALAALIGKTPAEAPPEATACRRPPTLAQPLPVGDGAALLKRRPDIRQSERLLAAATARIGVATADLYPTISLGGGITDGVGSSARLGNFNTTTYSVGPLLSWSFPNILTARAHVREANAQASAALAGFDSTVLKALRDAETALSVYAAELDRHAALLSAQTQAADALRLADIQFKSGAASFLDLLGAEAAAVAADQAVAQSDLALSADQVAVFQQLGGGWEGAPAVVTPKAGGR
jgi:NodT family efflux transporter outer membrane factor (OMF) lipoprotein